MLEDILNFLPLSETLMCAGMPTREQMASVSKAGVKVVINLAPFDPAQDLANEAELVESLGMTYIHIPVDWEAPTWKNLEDFMQVMDENTSHKLMVHCRANYRATGFITLYRVLRLGWNEQNAFRDLRRIWNPAEYPVWQKFIRENLEKSEG